VSRAMTLDRLAGLCGLAGGGVLFAYFGLNVFVAPPAGSARAFLEFAAAVPLLAFLDDWLLLIWLILTMGVVLGLHRRLSAVAPDEALFAAGVGLLGLGVGVLRTALNIGRMQVLAEHYAVAPQDEREMLVRLLGWTDQGDAARIVALGLVGGWALWTGALGLRTAGLPRWTGWTGVIAGLSVVPALAGYALSVPFLTAPDRYLAVVLVLWAGWTTALGVTLLRPAGSGLSQCLRT